MSTGRKPIAPALRAQIRTFSADQAFWRDCADLSHVAHLPARTRWTLALEMDGRTRDGQPLLVAINVALAADVAAGLAISFGSAGAIAEQATGFGSFAVGVDRRYGIACGQGDDAIALVEEQRVGIDVERVGLLVRERCEGGVDLAACPGIENHGAQPHSMRSRLRVRPVDDARADK